MTRLKMDITKKIYDKLDGVNFNNVRFTLKSTGCTLVSGGEIEKDHHLIIEMEIAEENQMNIDNLATQTPEEKEALDAVDFSRACEIGRSKLKSNPVIQLSIDEIDKFSGNEWNGEGLPPVGVECEYKDGDNWYEVKVNYLSEWFIVIEALKSQSKWIDIKGTEISFDYSSFDDLKFRKPESPQQRDEREKLEAAYDLYCEWRSNKGCESFEVFSNCNVDNWLAIVDKTNYRKESN